MRGKYSYNDYEFLRLIHGLIIIVSLNFVCGVEHFLANINQVSLKQNVIFIVYLAFVKMFRFESDFTDPTLLSISDRICISSLHCEEPFAVLAHHVQNQRGRACLETALSQSAVMLMCFLHM
jgi:hypothetical protein